MAQKEATIHFVGNGLFNSRRYVPNTNRELGEGRIAVVTDLTP